MRSRTPPLGSSPRLLQLEKKKSPRSSKDPEQPKNKFFKLFFKKKKLTVMILRGPTSQRITMKRHSKERHPKMSIGSKEPIFPNVYFGCGHTEQQKWRTLPRSGTTWTRTMGPGKLFQGAEPRLHKAETRTHISQKESQSHSIMSYPVTPWTIQSMEFSRPEYSNG